jgi:hypothetical protein
MGQEDNIFPLHPVPWEPKKDAIIYLDKLCYRSKLLYIHLCLSGPTTLKEYYKTIIASSPCHHLFAFPTLVSKSLRNVASSPIQADFRGISRLSPDSLAG